MSLLAELSPYPGSRKKRKRIGRGRGSGRGGTSGKGHKGQKARKGVRIPPGFEGGGMPLSRRLPKFGFTNACFKKEWDIVNLSRLQDVFGKKDSAGSEITLDFLKAKGLASGKKPVRILGKTKGGFALSLNIKAHHISASAKALIEKAGGKCEILPWTSLREIRNNGASKTSAAAGGAAAKRPVAQKILATEKAPAKPVAQTESAKAKPVAKGSIAEKTVSPEKPLVKPLTEPPMKKELSESKPPAKETVAQKESAKTKPVATKKSIEEKPAKEKPVAKTSAGQKPAKEKSLANKSDAKESAKEKLLAKNPRTEKTKPNQSAKKPS